MPFVRPAATACHLSHLLPSRFLLWWSRSTSKPLVPLTGESSALDSPKLTDLFTQAQLCDALLFRLLPDLVWILHLVLRPHLVVEHPLTMNWPRVGPTSLSLSLRILSSVCAVMTASLRAVLISTRCANREDCHHLSDSFHLCTIIETCWPPDTATQDEANNSLPMGLALRADCHEWGGVWARSVWVWPTRSTSECFGQMRPKCYLSL